MKRMKKMNEPKIWTAHFEEQRQIRKVSLHLVEACLKKGKILEKNGALHYVLKNLHVVVDIQDETLLTTYFRTAEAA